MSNCTCRHVAGTEDTCPIHGLNPPHKGQLVTRLLGRLKILHRSGTIEFEIRNPDEIRKRGVRTILTIKGLGEIPYITDGISINIDALYQGNIDTSFRKTDEDITEILTDRRERS